jgi:hypothetical protein
MLDQPTNIRTGEEIDVGKLTTYLQANLADFASRVEVL